MENGADSHKDEAGKEEHALLKQGVWNKDDDSQACQASINVVVERPLNMTFIRICEVNADTTTGSVQYGKQAQVVNLVIVKDSVERVSNEPDVVFEGFMTIVDELV